MIRRNYLKHIGGAALAASAFSGTAAGDYAEIIDVVADLGVDDTGVTAIDDDLEPHLNDGVKLEFPAGTYRIDQLILYGLSDVALVATGDATLVPGDYPSDDVWIGGGSVRNLRFEGFRLDTTGDVGPSIGFGAWDGLVVRDIEKVGAHATHKTAFGFEIWKSDGSGLIEGLRATDGDIYSDSVGATAIYSNSNGTLTYRNCEIAGWGDNGLYASDSTGPIQVEGGYYANNNVSQVRLSSPGSYVKDARIEVTEARGGDSNMRGVRVCDGPGPVDVINTDIVLERGQGGGGVVAAHDGGTVNVANSRIHVESDYTTVGSSGTRTSYGIYFADTSGLDTVPSHLVTGTSITGGGPNAGAALFRRGNTTVRDSCINQDGTDRDGIIYQKATTNNRVETSTVCVENAPFVTNDSELAKSDITFNDTCPVPRGVDYQQYTPTLIDITNAPIPDESSRLARPLTGTAKENTTAVIFGNYTDPKMASFVADNFMKILRDFVSTGALNIRLRMVPATADEELLVKTGLAIWDKEPENYWGFFEYVFTNQDSIQYQTVDDIRDLCKAAGVRNWGWIPWLAAGDDYAPLMNEDMDVAGSIPSWDDYPPILELDGDYAAPQYAYDGGIKTWLNRRL